jgi:hypothetical protein
MNRLLPLLAFLTTLAPGAIRAAPLERDLGQGLAYFRIHSLPADLPSDESVRRQPCVVDVRYVHGDRAAAVALLAWLKSHAAPKSPVILLANPETAPVLLVPLNSANAVPGLLVVGPSARNFGPDISVSVPPSVERRAYEALEKGASVDSLITVPVVKARNDEERLDQEHLEDNAPPDEAGDAQTPETADSAPDAGKAAKPPAPPPLIDPVLQRAVQIHRALVALRRL